MLGARLRATNLVVVSLYTTILSLQLAVWTGEFAVNAQLGQVVASRGQLP